MVLLVAMVLVVVEVIVVGEVVIMVIVLDISGCHEIRM